MQLLIARTGKVIANVLVQKLRKPWVTAGHRPESAEGQGGVT
jgi:hypothetical protein